MDRGSSGGSWVGDETSDEEVSIQEEICTEMSVDYEAQVLVYQIIQEAALAEKTPMGSRLDVDDLKNIYAWLSSCREAMNDFDKEIERISDELA